MEKEQHKVSRKEEMVKRMGVFFEQLGLTPMHGRVFAYLLLAEPPYQDFYQIQEFLKASKSAISNALKFLIDRNSVKYLTFSGDRRRYFQVNLEGFQENIRTEIKQSTIVSGLIKEVLAERADTKFLEFNEQLEEMVRFSQALSQTLDQFLIRWDQEHNQA
ncbi:MAG: MarR family transcriptional regulator [Lewinella sp.]|nr:MarR family transcriptional regulator [Lewinella sp.]